MKPENKTPSFLLPSWKWPLFWSGFLTIAFIICSVTEMKQGLPSCLAGDMHAVLWGLIYVVVYISMIVTVPVLIIYAAILWLLHRLMTRSAG